MAAQLTQADCDTLVRAVLAPDDDCAHNFVPLFSVVERMLTTRCSPLACGQTNPRVIGRCGRDRGHVGRHRSTGVTFEAWWD